MALLERRRIVVVLIKTVLQSNNHQKAAVTFAPIITLPSPVLIIITCVDAADEVDVDKTAFAIVNRRVMLPKVSV